jgi:hypothetical protein
VDEKRANHPKRVSAVELLLASKDDTITYDDNRNMEFN